MSSKNLLLISLHFSNGKAGLKVNEIMVIQICKKTPHFIGSKYPKFSSNLLKIYFIFFSCKNKKIRQDLVQSCIE